MGGTMSAMMLRGTLVVSRSSSGVRAVAVVAARGKPIRQM